MKSFDAIELLDDSPCVVIHHHLTPPLSSLRLRISYGGYGYLKLIDKVMINSTDLGVVILVNFVGRQGEVVQF